MSQEPSSDPVEWAPARRAASCEGAHADAYLELTRHAPALRAAARALGRGADDCEDLVQDTFERALHYLAGGDAPVRNARAWLVAILRHLFIDRMRVERPTTAEVDDLPAVVPEPQPAWADITGADVRAAAAALEPPLRAVFELRYLEGHCYREIARRIGVPENTVASRLLRARRAIRDRLLAPPAAEPDC